MGDRQNEKICIFTIEIRHQEYESTFVKTKDKKAREKVQRESMHIKHRKQTL